MSEWRIGVVAAACVAAMVTGVRAEPGEARNVVTVESMWVDSVTTPRVVTDQSIDCSSLESIVKGVVKPGMSDEQKVLALYHWLRRVCFHYRDMGADRRDVLQWRVELRPKNVARLCPAFERVHRLL